MMRLLDDQDGTIPILLRFLGIRDIRGSCSDPDAEIELTFNRHGQEVIVKFTLREFLDGLRKHTISKPPEPPQGYQDVADLPDG